MAQSAVELPDPLHDRATAHAGGADDLLAQLAGDEIDRLLAESDVERPGQVAKSIASDESVAPPADTAGPVNQPAPREVAVERHEPPEFTAPASEVHQPSAQPTAALLSPIVVAANKPIAWWMMPLVWLSAPLNSAPPAVKEAVGKIAIFTTVNALAVLIFVALFRHPHP